MIRIKIAAQEYTGFESVNIQRSIDTIADGFDITIITDDNTGIAAFGYDDIEIYNDNELLLTGIIEIIEKRVKGQSAMTILQGRSKSAFLVDSSINEKRQWVNASMLNVLNELATPYGININADNALPTMAQITAHYGEPIGAFVQRLAKANGVLVRSTSRGDITIGRITPESPVERWDDNKRILAYTVRADGTAKYRNYSINYQNVDGTLQQGKAIDDTVNVPRNYTTVSDTFTPSIQNITEWAQQQYARALNIEVALDRLYNNTGTTWGDGQSVEIIGIEHIPDGRYIIENAMIHESSKGSRAMLKLSSENNFI